jgi:uracil-DNA glycosylase
MLAGDLNHCIGFPCSDVRHTGNVRPALPARRENVRVIMISAAPPADPAEAVTDYDDPVVRAETIAAFRAADYDVSTVADVRNLGVYVTTAVKCPKIGFGLRPETIANCSHLLEAELALFPNVKSILLMGNSAIKAINEIATRRFGEPAIPTGSAYKVKGHEYRLGEISLFPSYPASGRNLSVEGDRTEVIAVDIRNALEVAGGPATRPHRTGPLRERRHSPEARPREVLGKSVE